MASRVRHTLAIESEGDPAARVVEERYETEE
jgi:hypothetical protein